MAAGTLVERQLKFDLEKALKSIKNLKLAVSDRLFEQAFDKCDTDKDGKLNR